MVVMGSANMDLVVQVERHPMPGETVFGDSLTSIAGGKGLNQAVACARAGGRVEFVGAVGSDEYGDQLLDVLRSEGIGVAGVRRVSGPTGTAHIRVDPAGQNSIVVVAGANAQVGPEVTAAMPEGAGWLLTQLEVPLGAVQAALEWCRERQIKTVLTPAPVLPLDPELLGLVDLLVPNQFEACQLTGVNDAELAAAKLSELVTDVVVTLGAEGSVWASGGRVRHREPAREAQVVDTTAAGDTFLGVLVGRLSGGVEMPEAMRWAAAAAAIGVSRPGASASMPTMAEVIALLA